MFAKFMNKKDFHPGSNANIKRVWMAEQKLMADKQKQQELTDQYQREQERYHNRQMVSNDDKLKSGLGFLYDAPPGYEKDKEKKKEEEEEPRFEWQKGAPREGYTKNLNLAVRDQPFGIPVRNVRCIRCGKWGHVNTDRECPKLNNTSLSKSNPSTFADVADPAQLMKEMRDGGLALKQGVLGRKFNPLDPNQQILASDDEEQDPEAEFLASLTDKQKRKLLRKLDKLERKEQEGGSSKNKTKKKKKHGRKTRGSDSEDGEKSRSREKRSKRYSSSDSEEQSVERKKRKTKQTKRPVSSNSEEEKVEKHRRESSKRSSESDNKRKTYFAKESQHDRKHKERESRGRDSSSEGEDERSLREKNKKYRKNKKERSRTSQTSSSSESNEDRYYRKRRTTPHSEKESRDMGRQEDRRRERGREAEHDSNKEQRYRRDSHSRSDQKKKYRP